jgi:RHS repeat-associated protein
VTDYRGEVYEHLEYTPYGELWVEEVRAGGEKTPFRFTGKRLDEETGLYYYGARYLDPQTSRWLSTDPAMGEYIPQAPVDEEARKRNGNLPGMGGVYNTVNLHVYHYAGNNPIKYIDPDGEWVVNNIAVGQNKTRDFASNPKILKSVDRHYFGGCQGGFVFDSHSVTMSNKPRKLFSSNFTRIELENGLNDFIKKSAEYNNDNNSRSSGILTAREERMDNGIYEIKATITVRDGVSTPRSRTGTIAFAGFSEISTDGQIDQAKVYAIAYKTVEYTYQAMEK